MEQQVPSLKKMSKNNWRNDAPTEKQLAFIEVIYKTVNQSICREKIPKFKGKTKGEACDYISKYKKLYDEEPQLYLEDVIENVGDH